MQQLGIRIADVTLSIISADPSLQLHADGPLRDFVVSGSDPDVIIGAAWDDLPSPDKGDRKIFDSGSVWQLYERDESYLFLFHSPLSGPAPYKTALMNNDYTRGKVLLNRRISSIQMNPFILLNTRSMSSS
ncbi:MAG: hypothetical protein MZV70_65975 [Desulfobacterales bacterium]|nr:hypothetical protein [Desulfobacterales bacterium]